jgi:hypothetical protein
MAVLQQHPNKPDRRVEAAVKELGRQKLCISSVSKLLPRKETE